MVPILLPTSSTYFHMYTSILYSHAMKVEHRQCNELLWMDKCSMCVCVHMRNKNASGGSQIHISTVHFTNPAKQDWTMCNLLHFFPHHRVHSAFFVVIAVTSFVYLISLRFWQSITKKTCTLNGFLHTDLEHCSKFSNIWI